MQQFILREARGHASASLPAPKSFQALDSSDNIMGSACVRIIYIVMTISLIARLVRYRAPYGVSARVIQRACEIFLTRDKYSLTRDTNNNTLRSLFFFFSPLSMGENVSYCYFFFLILLIFGRQINAISAMDIGANPHDQIRPWIVFSHLFYLEKLFDFNDFLLGISMCF